MWTLALSALLDRTGLLFILRQVVCRNLKLESVRIGKVDRVRDLVVLKLKWNCSSPKFILSAFEVSVHWSSEREMRNREVRPLLVLASKRKQRDERRAQAQKDWNAVPLAGKHVLKSKDAHIPRLCRFGRLTPQGDVIDLIQAHLEG